MNFIGFSTTFTKLFPVNASITFISLPMGLHPVARVVVYIWIG